MLTFILKSFVPPFTAPSTNENSFSLKMQIETKTRTLKVKSGQTAVNIGPSLFHKRDRPDYCSVLPVSTVGDDVQVRCPYLKLPFPVHDGGEGGQ